MENNLKLYPIAKSNDQDGWFACGERNTFEIDFSCVGLSKNARGVRLCIVLEKNDVVSNPRYVDIAFSREYKYKFPVEFDNIKKYVGYPIGEWR
jgi:hypothetical protein